MFGAYPSGGSNIDLAAERVDVILRPNPAVARKTVDIDRIWGEEIIFHNVPVYEARDSFTYPMRD